MGKRGERRKAGAERGPEPERAAGEELGFDLACALAGRSGAHGFLNTLGFYISTKIPTSEPDPTENTQMNRNCRSMQRDGETSLETWLVPFTCCFLSPFPFSGFYSVCCCDFILVSNDLPLLFPPHTFLRICLAAVCKPRESPEGRDGSLLPVTLTAFPGRGWLSPSPCPLPSTFRPSSAPAGPGLGPGWPRGPGRLCGRLSGGFVSSLLGDSFAVNASLARKGLEDWMVKQKYSGGSSSGGSSSGLQQGCQHRAVCRLSSARVCQLPRCPHPSAPSF